MKYHFISVAGTGMGSAAGLLKVAGHQIKGSDEEIYPPMSTLLADREIEVLSPFSETNLDWNPDEVIVGNVCRWNHLEVETARKKGLSMTSFPEVLGRKVLAGGETIVVAGTHGKTTTTTMLSFLLDKAGKKPGWLIGGVPKDLDISFQLPGSDLFVIEGDEYDTAFFDKNPKFLHYRPKGVVLTGIEFDHADIYDDFNQIKKQFQRLRNILPPAGTFLVSANCATAMELISRGPGEAYGLESDGEPQWKASSIDYDHQGTDFVLSHCGRELGKFHLNMMGEHNLRNCVAALAMALIYGISSEQLVAILPEFSGVKKRQEIIEETNGSVIMEDFAHHPTAVKETLKGLKSMKCSRIIAVFEPRSATSRRKIFQKPYAEAFDDVEIVLIKSPHDQSRINSEDRFSSRQLAADLQAKGKKSETFATVNSIVTRLLEIIESGDLIVFFSSGSFGGISRKFADEYKKSRIEKGLNSDE
ncbi:MAG: Mur ligase family protein [Deltaproteobacteria bacterium]|jgi:UDP-N-acetylmuramate: L-alanyl-gamma-D-glutamyl-meso-diaminopimelate ligase|nr:Mur ligase family protein [Deltaproteobacteria bacterium]